MRTSCAIFSSDATRCCIIALDHTSSLLVFGRNMRASNLYKPGHKLLTTNTAGTSKWRSSR
jgi:hypothetical protein